MAFLEIFCVEDVLFIFLGFGNIFGRFFVMGICKGIPNATYTTLGNSRPQQGLKGGDDDDDDDG